MLLALLLLCVLLLYTLDMKNNTDIEARYGIGVSMGYGFYNTRYTVNLRIVQIRVVSLWRSFVTTAQNILVVSSRIENQRGHRVCRMSTIERLNVNNTHAT